MRQPRPLLPLCAACRYHTLVLEPKVSLKVAAAANWLIHCWAEPLFNNASVCLDSSLSERWRYSLA